MLSTKANILISKKAKPCRKYHCVKFQLAALISLIRCYCLFQVQQSRAVQSHTKPNDMPALDLKKSHEDDGVNQV